MPSSVERTPEPAAPVSALALGTGSAVWSKQMPGASGFYWYRESADAKPDVVIFQLRQNGEYFLPYVWRFAPAEPLGGMFYRRIDGEFWSAPILPPNIQSEPRHE